MDQVFPGLGEAFGESGPDHDKNQGRERTSLAA